MNFDTDARKTMDSTKWMPADQDHDVQARDTIQIRTCLYKGEKALWHRWVETNDGNMPIRAMIETEDGKLHFVMPWSIQFTDRLVERRHG